MTAVDTNVLLRYLLHDDDLQTAQADAIFNTAETILITDVVLVETVWTLVGRKEGGGNIFPMFRDSILRNYVLEWPKRTIY